VQSINAFIGHPEPPSEPEITAALGPSAPAWTQFLQWMHTQGVTAQEWQSTSAKYGWSLRLKHRDRNIVYLVPCQSCFRVSFVLGGRAMEAVRHAQFPPAVAQLIAASPHYAEGAGIRLIVRNPQDLDPIRILATIKLTH